VERKTRAQPKAVAATRQQPMASSSASANASAAVTPKVRHSSARGRKEQTSSSSGQQQHGTTSATKNRSAAAAIENHGGSNDSTPPIPPRPVGHGVRSNSISKMNNNPTNKNNNTNGTTRYNEQRIAYSGAVPVMPEGGGGGQKRSKSAARARPANTSSNTNSSTIRTSVTAGAQVRPHRQNVQEAQAALVAAEKAAAPSRGLQRGGSVGPSHTARKLKKATVPQSPVFSVMSWQASNKARAAVR
jgi:hypothetical protein